MAVSEMYESHIAIYPNPAGREIVIGNDSQKGTTFSLSVYDMTGKQILKKDAVFGESIDVGKLPSGSYMLKVEHNGITTVRKLLKR